MLVSEGARADADAGTDEGADASPEAIELTADAGAAATLLRVGVPAADAVALTLSTPLTD